MTPKRSFQAGESPRLEPLEARLLLSADTLVQLSPDSVPLMEGAIVPAVIEAESEGGPANDDIASAQELEFSYLLPWVGSEDGFGPQQASVIGTADGAGSGGEEYFQSKMLFAVIAYPNWFSLDFTDAILPAGDGVLAVSVKADLGGSGKYLTLEADGSYVDDLFVDDGQTGVKVSTEVVLSQQRLADLAADGTITFTIRPSSEVLYTGTNYVIMELTYSGGGGGAGTADFYSFDLAAGESASLAVTGTTPGELDLQLYDAAGALLATGQAANDHLAISGFHAEQAGTYYVSVSGSGDYNLLVDRNATMDLEDNDSLAAAQELQNPQVDGRRWAVGSVSGDSDLYTVNVSAGGRLMLRAYAPGDKAGLNDLEPVINVYDVNGNLVAGGDGDSVNYRLPAGGGGLYYVEVTGADGSSGDYVLSAKVQGKPSKSGPRGQAKGHGGGLSDPLDVLMI